MNNSSYSRHMVLMVANPGQLKHGCKAIHCFGPAGGTIGSRGDWRLHDHARRIQAIECEVRWHEDSFCVTDRSGHTRLNGSAIHLAPGVRIRFKPHDTLQVGDYLIVAQPALANTHQHGKPFQAGAPGEHACPLHALGRALHAPDQEGENQYRSPSHADQDPLACLDKVAQARLDPTFAELFGSHLGAPLRDREAS